MIRLNLDETLFLCAFCVCLNRGRPRPHDVGGSVGSWWNHCFPGRREVCASPQRLWWPRTLAQPQPLARYATESSCVQKSHLRLGFASSNNSFHLVSSWIDFIVMMPQVQSNVELFFLTCADHPKEKHSDGEEEEEKKNKSGKEQKAVKKEDGSTGKKPCLYLVKMERCHFKKRARSAETLKSNRW